MAQRPPASLGRVEAASAKHIGGQFESHITAVKKDNITESDSDLQHASTNRNHEFSHSLDVKKPAKDVSGWIIVDRQSMITEIPASNDTVHHSTHTNSSSISAQGAMIPLQRWQSEAAKAQSWNGLQQVSKESNETTKVPKNVKKSMETCEDSTGQASFNDSGRRNGYT